MSRRRSAENPFLRVMLAEQNKRKELAEFKAEVLIQSQDTEAKHHPEPVVLQISEGLVDQLNFVTEDVRRSLPPELHSGFSIETMNELTIAYLISDFCAHNDGRSIAERLSQGWAKTTQSIKDE